MTVFSQIKMFNPPSWAAFTDGAITTNRIEHFPPSSIPTLYGLDGKKFKSRLRRVMSKCVVLNDRCIFWAGDVELARHACRALIAHNPRTQEEFNAVIGRLDPKTLASVQIMLTVFDGEAIREFGYWLYGTSLSQSVELVGGGSGWEDLIEISSESSFGFDLHNPQTSEITNAVYWALAAIASMLDIERNSPVQGHLDYGGCADLISFGPTGFVRESFCVIEAITSKVAPREDLAITGFFASYGIEGGSIVSYTDLTNLDPQDPFVVSQSHEILADSKQKPSLDRIGGPLPYSIVRVRCEDRQYTYFGNSPFHIRTLIEDEMVRLDIEPRSDKDIGDVFYEGLNSLRWEL